MKYKELISFEPIETLIVLKNADKKEEAIKLVKNYVMSESMADSLCDVVIPQLQFDDVIDNKGIFIVGNYGTGKSHLMSVISSVAEDIDLLQFVENKRFSETAIKIAGKFEVLRFELGATERRLRDIVISSIEKDLLTRGINYTFPSMSEINDNKECLTEMMSKFEEKYPDKGYIIVVDELLDYLRTRKELEIMLDFSFLREVGEVSKNTRLRFVAGIQETLFDNPTFNHVANTLYKVKDRFEQIMIKRDDISYVVERRLLQKTDKQKAWIREHLQQYSYMYKNMSDRMEEYVNLFPIHPAFLETFEKVYIVERREILKTISASMKKLIETDVPENQMGLLSFDEYWNTIKSNPAYSANEDVKKVVNISGILESKVENSIKKQYKSMALRIVYGLSIYRLTTGTINATIGMTIDNLKDDLCLYDPHMPEQDEEFLRSTIITTMKEITNVVDGQFIEYNKDNEQYFIDVKKDVNYDAKIEQMASMLDDDTLNHYYYELIQRAMERATNGRFTGYKIWDIDDLIWEEKNVYRLGYMFFGKPNERETAKPEMDYYFYFLPPFGVNDFIDENRNDEVFIEFETTSPVFKDTLKLYGGSKALSLNSSSDSKETYDKKATSYMRTLTDFIKNNVTNCIKIRYKGEQKSLLQVVANARTQTIQFKDYIYKAISQSLNGYFADKYPNYPTFKTKITRDNQNANFKEALAYIAGKKTELGAKMLDSLELLEDGEISVYNSKYGKKFLDLINSLPDNKVLNKEDILTKVSYFDDDMYVDSTFQIEDLWVVVLLASLVHAGEINLAVDGKKFDATIDSDILVKAICGEGVSTIDEIKLRFDKYIKEIVKGKDVNKLRIEVNNKHNNVQ